MNFAEITSVSRSESGSCTSGIAGERLSVAVPALADPLPVRTGSGEWRLDWFDSDRGAVGGAFTTHWENRPSGDSQRRGCTVLWHPR
jgi:hypothetical protein